MSLLKNITTSQQLSEAAIYNKILYSFPDMLHSNVHPPRIYLRATSTSQLAEADLPAGMVQWNGEAVLVMWQVDHFTLFSITALHIPPLVL